MSPLQLFVEGSSQTENDNEPSNPENNSNSTLPSEDLESVQVPSSKFLPCIPLSTELNITGSM